MKTSNSSGGSGTIPKPVSTFRLTRHFSIASLIGVIIVVTVLVYYYRHFAFAALEQHEKRDCINITQLFANTLWPRHAAYVKSASTIPIAELRQRPEVARIREDVLLQMKDLMVVKVKIYALDGLTVFSTDPKQIGEDKSTNSGFLAAKSGKAVSEITFRDRFDAFEQVINDRDLASSYVPIRTKPDAPVEGVMEVYTDVTVHVKDLQATTWKIATGVLGSLSLLYLFLFAIVRRADLIIRAQEEEMRASTERKQAERNQLAAIVENSNDAIFSRALDGTILSWNAGAEKMLGYGAAEAIGRQTDFIRPPGRESDRKENNERVLRGEVVVRESDRITKDGRLINVSTSHSPIRDGSGKVVGVSLILQDTTKFKRSESERASLEAQLRESQKMEAIGTLAGGIAHDFNNIIAIILGNVQLMRQDVSDLPQAQQRLERIQQAGVRARDLVRQILAFSRRQPTSRKPLVLTPVVEETARLLRATLPARLELQVHCDPEVPPVLADATQIQQALINLATNAMQAIPSGPGRIALLLDSMTLDAALVGAHFALQAFQSRYPGRKVVRLSIRDNGPGMDAATQERIFEPFFTTKPAGEGTGLGLSVVHGIIQGHEGEIVVESQVGSGATFTIYLPAISAQARATESECVEAAFSAPSMRGDSQILYIDDDEGVLFTVKTLLERRGYRVSAYTDPHAALAVFRADPAAFDLVLTDYNMPRMSGLDVARQMHATRAEVAVVIVSGFIDETLRAQAEAAGVTDLIPKADEIEVYCATIRRLLETVGRQPKSS